MSNQRVVYEVSGSGSDTEPSNWTQLAGSPSHGIRRPTQLTTTCEQASPPPSPTERPPATEPTKKGKGRKAVTQFESSQAKKVKTDEMVLDVSRAKRFGGITQQVHDLKHIAFVG